MMAWIALASPTHMVVVSALQLQSHQRRTFMTSKPSTQHIPPEIIGKAIADADFRKQLLSDPDGVFAAHGAVVPADVKSKLQNMNSADLDDAVASFSSKLKEGGGPA